MRSFSTYKDCSCKDALGLIFLYVRPSGLVDRAPCCGPAMRPGAWRSILILTGQAIKIVNNLSRGGLTLPPFFPLAVKNFFGLVKYAGRPVPNLSGGYQIA